MEKENNFRQYLKDNYDYLLKRDAVQIGVHEFDLSIKTSIDIYTEIYD